MYCVVVLLFSVYQEDAILRQSRRQSRNVEGSKFSM